MFNSIDEIYNHIGQSMVEALPEPWFKAYSYVLLDNVDEGVMSFVDTFFKANQDDNEQDFFLDIKKRMPRVRAYQALYKFMQKTPDDVPWNKARFTLTNDGDFDIEFKLDEDLIWLNNLDADSQEYDDLDINIEDQIRSWEGLPENADRYWLKK